MARRQGLGRGLGALLGDDFDESVTRNPEEADETVKSGTADGTGKDEPPLSIEEMFNRKMKRNVLQTTVEKQTEKESAEIPEENRETEANDAETEEQSKSSDPRNGENEDEATSLTEPAAEERTEEEASIPKENGEASGTTDPEKRETAESPAADRTENGEAVIRLSIHKIDPNKDQPRKIFEEESLKELADSIASVGVIQPIIVRPSGERYVIVAGERRYRAARLAGLEVIPAIVREADDALRQEVALIENLQRDDLNPIEEAEGIRSFMVSGGLTQEAAAERLGKSRPAVANALRLLNLEPSVQKMILDGKLSAGHGRALAVLSQERQKKLAQYALEHSLSVRQLEKLAALPEKETEEKPAKKEQDPQFAQLESMARELFGTKARLNGTQKNGRLTLYYYSEDDLQRIWDVLELIRGGQV